MVDLLFVLGLKIGFLIFIIVVRGVVKLSRTCGMVGQDTTKITTPKIMFQRIWRYSVKDATN
jgi:hypothetical protein